MGNKNQNKNIGFGRGHFFWTWVHLKGSVQATIELWLCDYLSWDPQILILQQKHQLDEEHGGEKRQHITLHFEIIEINISIYHPDRMFYDAFDITRVPRGT